MGGSEWMFKFLYYVSRKTATLPFRIDHHLLRRDAPAVHQGSIYDQLVEGVLGKIRYRKLCEDKCLSLETIFYCQEELSGVRKALQSSRKYSNPNYDKNERKKRLINHDFLILKIRPGKRDDPAFFIRAEKVAGVDDHRNQEGIHISVLSESFNAEDLTRWCLHRIECCSRIRLGEMLTILKKKSPKYDAIKDNCWDYARKTTKWLLEACMLVTSYDCEKYRRLHWELEQLEVNLARNHTANTFQRVSKFVKIKLYGAY